VTNAKPKSIAAAIVRAQSLAVAVEKSSTNNHQRYAYASAESIMQTGTECLAAAGLALVCKAWDVRPVEGRGEGYFCDVSATFELLHESGESREIGPYVMPAICGRGRPQDKAISTALTYLQGYGLRGLLNLPRVEQGAEVDARDDNQWQPRSQPQQQAQQRPAKSDEQRKADLEKWRKAWKYLVGCAGPDRVKAEAKRRFDIETNERGKGLSLERIQTLTRALDPTKDERSGTYGGGNRSRSA
jgi:hypothetical protein